FLTPQPGRVPERVATAGGSFQRRAFRGRRSDDTGKPAVLLDVLRNSNSSKSDYEEAAAALVLGGHLADAAAYANAITTACSFRKIWVVALEALAEMRSRGIGRDSSVYLAAINSCGASGLPAI
ncbi:unnamed protein product, partial [Polarella glacialis]